MPIRVKICGLTDATSLDVAVAAGASYIGLVQFPPSPRHIALGLARKLALRVPAGVAKVALVVDADNQTLDELIKTVPLDMLQLHGNESSERVSEIRGRYGLPVMKAIGIATADDLYQIKYYAEVVDQLLIDAKPPKGATRPGGNALAFDWELIAQQRWTRPWMLAGGLTPDNVANAIRQTRATQVDVSSGVETSLGVKSAKKIDTFIKSVQGIA